MALGVQVMRLSMGGSMRRYIYLAAEILGFVALVVFGYLVWGEALFR